MNTIHGRPNNIFSNQREDTYEILLTQVIMLNNNTFSTTVSGARWSSPHFCFLAGNWFQMSFWHDSFKRPSIICVICHSWCTKYYDKSTRSINVQTSQSSDDYTDAHFLAMAGMQRSLTCRSQQRRHGDVRGLTCHAFILQASMHKAAWCLPGVNHSIPDSDSSPCIRLTHSNTLTKSCTDFSVKLSTCIPLKRWVQNNCKYTVFTAIFLCSL